MFTCDHKTLTLSFNEFHDVKKDDMPQYGEYCLLELKDGRHTAGDWLPKDSKGDQVAGRFCKGTADTVDVEEVAKWHSLRNYDLTNCLNDEKVGHINMGSPTEDGYSVKFGDFKSFEDGDFPKEDRFCLLIMKDGSLAAGRWYPYTGKKDGCFIYESALASHSMKKVWAWTELSPDDVSEQEEERERERKREEELNEHPVVDLNKFKYGTDIKVYYKKALEKLKKDYPWATLTQMKKRTPYVIVPRHGQYIFGMDLGTFMGEKDIREWKDGSTSEEFIDFLCEYTKQSVIDANPTEKFKLGTDIQVYLDKAYETVKKEYRWLEKDSAEEYCEHAIKQVDGDLEFVKRYGKKGKFFVCDYGTSESFIESVVSDYQNAALRANTVVKEYPVKFGSVEISGWWLEKYVVSKMKSGDYKVDVTAGDRTTGGSREFFITPYCFEAKTYDEFLDRYQEIVPGRSFGLTKEDLLKDKGLQKFFGY